MAKCKYYVPAWGGNRSSGSQPAFCLKYKMPLSKDENCIKNCKIGKSEQGKEGSRKGECNREKQKRSYS